MCISKRAIQVSGLGSTTIKTTSILQDGSTTSRSSTKCGFGTMDLVLQDLRKANSALVEELLAARKCAEARHQDLVVAEACKASLC